VTSAHDPHRTPWLALAAPAAGWGLLAAEGAGAVDYASGAALALAAPLLGASVFAAVHHAEVLAARVGQPFGALLLALAVTAIEAALIVSIMLHAAAGAEAEAGAPPDEVARDTVFAAVMLVLNGVVGLCLLVGGLRWREQGFRAQGAAAALSVVGTLATLALILPEYTISTPGPFYAPAQLIFVATTAVALYALFIFVQTVRHRADFLDGAPAEPAGPRPSARAAALSAVTLAAALGAVVLLAETLSPAVAGAVREAGMPGSVVGVVIAAVTLLPEGASALRAAWINRPQTSLNLALGSALASTGLTIPTVAFVSLWFDLPLALGLDAEHIILLALTLFAATLTLATGRTTVLQGGVHLVILGAFLTIAMVP
jgi:Ca2+:H+ antiporter